MASLTERLLRRSTLKSANILSDSDYHKIDILASTTVPMVNVVLSGALDGGITPGLTIWAGPSKHFKTGFSLLMVKAFLDKYDDGVVLFYDCEFGAPESYFKSFGIDVNKIIHIPITNMEEWKFDMIQQLDEIKETDNVMIFVDSIGNMSSKKEFDDAEAGKSVADMTRAKQMKSIFRMVTPHLTMKKIPLVCVNHTYQETGLFAKTVVSGGTGVMYSANSVYVVGRAQDKKGTELNGYDFKIKVVKSRFVREGSVIPLKVSFEDGISTWSGLLDIALELGFVTKPSNGWYCVSGEDTKYRAKDTDCSDFWLPILTNKEFQDAIENRYAISSDGGLILDDEVEEDV